MLKFLESIRIQLKIRPPLAHPEGRATGRMVWEGGYVDCIGYVGGDQVTRISRWICKPVMVRFGNLVKQRL